MAKLLIINEKEYIRAANIDDIEELSLLSISLENYVFKEKMPEWFKEELSFRGFRFRVTSSQFKHFVYVKDEEIVGFIAIKNDNHIFHLFVKESFHRQGIAKKLWQCVKEIFDVSNMEVNSSLYAIKVYESFGFKISDEEKFFFQLRFQPMRYDSFYL
ncbi:hypothetical protein CRV08_13045 [Halarcobacter ebronensis]|uniref:N-acetyltransferase domain-containing protein n=1 Tax=Halarcobacter ebronensis TaxID=1462615 RepID=A0A4Q0YBF1_9BACT|nr:GNAT family N-acetyltransferase [Halarcobacter ebronensis]RXJ66399.1 hypothetical protein CRV08_13045 [Halarcobacter ebronensis]RXK02125.1 hypothetical protein CRV07_14010 [Halarcobacter ebronensis]